VRPPAPLHSSFFPKLVPRKGFRDPHIPFLAVGPDTSFSLISSLLLSVSSFYTLTQPRVGVGLQQDCETRSFSFRFRLFFPRFFGRSFPRCSTGHFQRYGQGFLTSAHPPLFFFDLSAPCFSRCRKNILRILFAH